MVIFKSDNNKVNFHKIAGHWRQSWGCVFGADAARLGSRDQEWGKSIWMT